MVTFPEEIHPKNGVRLRFDYEIRAYQYLDYFKIIKTTTHKFIPLDLTFESFNDLQKFLIEKGIVYYEIQVGSMSSELSNTITIVDTKKIYDVEESILKYLLNYKYYSINEIAEMLSLSRPTIYKLINDQSLKAFRINGQLRVNHLDIISFIKAENQV